jgi:hypothetical protein
MTGGGACCLSVVLTTSLLATVALAAPPDPPSNPSPADGAVDIPANSLLCVDVTDPDGDVLDVRFYGRRLTGEDFTVVAIPDSQFYSRDYPNIFNAQTQWIAEQTGARNIAFVTHLGDIVQTGSNATQWNRADTAMSYLEDELVTGIPDGVAYGVTPGNHDQAPLGSPRSGGDEGATTPLFTQHFGLHRFDGRWYYGGRYDFGDPVRYADNNDNNYQLFTAGGMDFIAVHLEYDQADSPQRDAVLQWVDNLLMAHANRRALITTHYMISPAALFSNQGQAIYDTVRDNPNVFLMLGGHVTEAARRIDEYNGDIIHSVLSDYQNRENGGNGWLRVMTFSPENDEIRVETYSPWLDQYDRGAHHDFRLAYEMVGPVPFSHLGSVSAVPSGSTACVPWSGRRAGVRYQWYAEVSDYETIAAGGRLSFISDGTCGLDLDCLDRDPCTLDQCSAGVCAGTGSFDGDFDAICEDLDNCPRIHNPLQVDSDSDGLGDVCDSCPEQYDPDQRDSDGDGAGDACECQPDDPNDREPAEITGLNMAGSTLTWTPVTGARVYSVSRGDLASLGAGAYGPCFAEGLADETVEDPESPAPGEGFFYMVQGQNIDCGLGHLGYDSNEVMRENLDPGACIGTPHTDAYATGERSIDGTVSGSLADTLASDDVYETITEVVSGGNPNSRHTVLEHRWTLPVEAGSFVEFHVEGYKRNLSQDGDDFVFEYSTDGGSTWIPIPLTSLPTVDNDIDLVGDLPANLVGDVLFRVVDTDHTPGGFYWFDWVSIDELFVRSLQ